VNGMGGPASFGGYQMPNGGFQSSRALDMGAGSAAVSNPNPSIFAVGNPNPWSTSSEPNLNSGGPIGATKIPSIPTLASLPGLTYGSTFASSSLWGQDGGSPGNGWGGGAFGANNPPAPQPVGPPPIQPPLWQQPQGPTQGW
jgi:hypothetical protein